MNNHDLNRVSLALNLVLLAGCVFFATHRRLREPASPAQTPGKPALNSPASESQTPVPLAELKPKPVEQRSWVEILRGQGVPANVIARLAIADFEDQWQSRQAKAQEAYNRGDLDADGLAALAREHDVEEENELLARLGKDAFRAWDTARLLQQFSLNDIPLTDGETNSLYELAANHRQQLRDLEKARQDNEMDQATFAAEQSKADADFQKQVRALLGDERYGALHGTDPAVGDLRRSLRGVNVDDQQFASLLEAEQQWDTARAHLEQQMVETSDTNLQRQIDSLGAMHDQTFTSILGTNGLALYQKQLDSRYLELQRNAARWGLDSGSIDYIYATIGIYEKAEADYRRKLREMEASGTKVDSQGVQQPWQQYEKEMAQYVRTNLTEAQYHALVQNQMLPFAVQ